MATGKGRHSGRGKIRESGRIMTPKEQLEKKLADNFHAYAYTYERFINGFCEFLVYPSDGMSTRGWHQNTAEGAPMRYRFNREGERI